MMSDEWKEKEARIEQMMYVSGQDEKLMKLLEYDDIVISESFVKEKRIQEIAEDLLKTKKGEEITKVGMKHGVKVFFSKQVKDIFLF